MLKARFRQCLSDFSSAKKRKAPHMLFQQLMIERLAPRFCGASNSDLQEKKAEVSQAQVKLLKGVKDSMKLEFSW